jgi:hypothetical protein
MISDGVVENSTLYYFNSLDLKCFKLLKKNHSNRFYRDTQRRDFRPLKDKHIFFRQ